MKRRGLVLGLVIITAVVMTIAAYTALFVALSLARRPGPMDEGQVRARFASEAGVIWAKERLYDNANGMLDRVKAAAVGTSIPMVPPRPPLEMTNGMSVDVSVVKRGADRYEIVARAAF